MLRFGRWLVLLVLALGCESNTGFGLADVRLDRSPILDDSPVDSRLPSDLGTADFRDRGIRPVDGDMLDAVVPIVDAGVVDQMLDRNVSTDLDRGPDAVVDMARPDQRVIVDMAVPDQGNASEPDLGQQDAALDASVVIERDRNRLVDDCQGVPLVRPGPSLDGTEVCNYLDDDGDGNVDEGHPYGWVDRLHPVLLDPLGDSYAISASSDGGLGITWTTLDGIHLLKVGANGCPSGIYSPERGDHWDDFAAIPQSVQIASGGQRFAIVFSRPRDAALPDGEGIATYFQLFDLAGLPIGGPVEVDPDLVFHRGQNAIVAVDDTFAILSEAFHPDTGRLAYSSFVIIDANGQLIEGPSHPFDFDEWSMLPNRLIGMAHDGEGFGLAWTGAANYFARWSREGQLLTFPGRVVDLGQNGNRVGMAWTGNHFAISNIHRDRSTLQVALLHPDGAAADESPIVVGRSDGRPNTLGFGALREGGFYHYGRSPDTRLIRFNSTGELVAPALDLDGPESVTWLTFSVDGPAMGLRRQIVADGGPSFLLFGRIGCAVGE